MPLLPLALAAAVVGVVLARRRNKTDASSSGSARASGADAATTPAVSAAAASSWLPEWGTPNEWDKRYPSADPTRPLPYTPTDLDPAFSAKLELAFDELRAAGWDPKVFEGGRSQRRQAWLYGQGRPEFAGTGRSGKQVTWILSASNHGTFPGEAVDVISASKGWQNMDFFYALGAAVKKQGLNWGGDWQKARDYPHVEFKPWKG